MRWTPVIAAAAVAACNSFDGGTGISTTPEAFPPLTVVATTPADSATGVALTTPIQATVSRPLNTATVSVASFTLAAGGGGTVVGSVTANLTTAAFLPDAPLAPGTRYTATLQTTITDTAGVSLDGPFTWSFTTGGP